VRNANAPAWGLITARAAKAVTGRLYRTLLQPGGESGTLLAGF